MSQPEKNPSSPSSGQIPAIPADELLIEYLDGELNDVSAAELESRLANDDTLRMRVNEFQQTWDMLDDVKRPAGDGRFVESTIEMLVTHTDRQRQRWHRWPLRIGAVMLAFAIPALIAIAGVRYFQTQPHRQLVAELLFWENMDVYNEIESVSFAEQLEAAEFFELLESQTVSSSDNKSSTAGPAETNRQRLEQMSATDLRKIRDRQLRFQQVPPQKQAMLQQLHDQLSSHPRREQLLTTIGNYYEWLKTIEPDERTQIKSQTGAARLNLVREIKRRYAEKNFGVAGDTQLPGDDVSTLFNWTQEFLDEKGDEIRQAFRSRMRSGKSNSSEKTGNPRLGARDPLDRIEPVLSEVIKPDDIDKLKQALSPSAIAIIDEQAGDEARIKLVCAWVKAAMQAQRQINYSSEDLMTFFDQELSAEQQRLIESKTAEQRRAETSQLIRSYQSRKQRDERSFPGFPGNRGRIKGKPDSDNK